jgi:hypothetical protein
MLGSGFGHGFASDRNVCSTFTALRQVWMRQAWLCRVRDGFAMPRRWAEVEAGMAFEDLK